MYFKKLHQQFFKIFFYLKFEQKYLEDQRIFLRELCVQTCHCPFYLQKNNAWKKEAETEYVTCTLLHIYIDCLLSIRHSLRTDAIKIRCDVRRGGQLDNSKKIKEKRKKVIIIRQIRINPKSHILVNLRCGFVCQGHDQSCEN